jgi:hypothetical protein
MVVQHGSAAYPPRGLRLVTVAHGIGGKLI